MKAHLPALVALLGFAIPSLAENPPPGTVKTQNAAIPKEVGESFRTLLSEDAVQIADGTGAEWATFWFRKAVPVKAAPEQIRNGLTYREVPQTTLVGLVRFAQPWSDFRKQGVPVGVYTLRMALQPMDGDHQGTAPYGEFLLLTPLAKDPRPGTMDVKHLHELSAEAPGGSHPCVMLLFPNDKPVDEPKLAAKPGMIWVLNVKRAVDADGTGATLGFGIVVTGHSTQE